jgi:hypothetical protein
VKIGIVDILRYVFKPYGIVLATVLMSFCAWALPDFGIIQKGYDQPQKLFSFGTLMAVAWYGSIILISWITFHSGRASGSAIKSFDRDASLDDFIAYCFLSVVGFIGFVYITNLMVSTFGFINLAVIVASGEANQLHKALYTDYSIGLSSLRYVVILSGGLAIYRIISGISRSVLDFFNICQLLLIAIIASRLSVVFALVIGFGLWAINVKKVEIKPIKWLILLAALFTLFAAYNYSRNIGTYIATGDSNFFSAGLSEIVKYLGTPFQGAIAAGNQFDQITLHPENVSRFTGINHSLTTNSALLQLVREYGYWSFPIMIFTSAIAAFLMGIVYRQRNNYLILIYFILLYCFAEIWRVFIFKAGIITTLLTFSFLSPFASIGIKWIIKQGKSIMVSKEKVELNK